MDRTSLEKMLNTYQAEQRIAEVVWFYEHAERINPKVVVEIGIKEGGNLKILSTLVPSDGLAIGIDTRKDIPWDYSKEHCEIHHVVGPSQSEEVISKVKELLGDRKIDVLFIDGDHSKEGMLADFHTYSPLVRSGGIIAVHDIYYLPDVMAAWDEISGKKYQSEKIDSSIGIGFVIKE